MTQYKFTVNAVSLTANLGWNANGTLQTQNITDAFNSSDTQNCSYGYDDVTRVASANCGTAASQTFSYDPFGNINKSGSPNQFQPFYSTSTNRMTSISGFTPTYDSNGNVLNDSFHTYTWDAEGHAVTIDAGFSDAVTVTYDALGRMVEQQRGSTYTQITYSVSRQKFALMSGSTLQKAMLPLSGHSHAVYNSSGLLYYAHPDNLGSIRLATTPSRTMYFDTAYAPYGETYASAGGANLDPAYTGQMNDTAHRQDTEGGLYDFPAREYSTQGRWPSPDPARAFATCPKNPQTQNRYAYVSNNPLSYIDPLGTQGCSEDDPNCGACDPSDPLCGWGPPIPGGGFTTPGNNEGWPSIIGWPPPLAPDFFRSIGTPSQPNSGTSCWDQYKQCEAGVEGYLDQCLFMAGQEYDRCQAECKRPCPIGPTGSACRLACHYGPCLTTLQHETKSCLDETNKRDDACWAALTICVVSKSIIGPIIVF